MKAVCQGSHVAIDVQAGMAPVAVVLKTNQARFCMEFGGSVTRDGSNGVGFSARDAPAPSACPVSPSGAFVDDAALF